jgi:uncharacterized alpha-E superfamily protein
MLSRVAAAIYWSARYVERAENVARFIDVNLNLMLDTPTAQRGNWQSLVMTTGDQSWFETHYGIRIIRIRFSRALPRRAKTRVPCARSSHARCGKS